MVAFAQRDAGNPVWTHRNCSVAQSPARNRQRQLEMSSAMDARGDLAGVKRSVATSMARYTPTSVHHSEMSAASAILSTSRMYTTIKPTTSVPIISLPPSLTTTTIEGIRASATLELCFQGPGLYRGGALGGVGGGSELPTGPVNASIPS